MTAITDQLATLRQAVQTLADTVRHHDAQLRQLGRGSPYPAKRKPEAN